MPNGYKKNVARCHGGVLSRAAARGGSSKTAKTTANARRAKAKALGAQAKTGSRGKAQTEPIDFTVAALRKNQRQTFPEEPQESQSHHMCTASDVRLVDWILMQSSTLREHLASTLPEVGSEFITEGEDWVMVTAT